MKNKDSLRYETTCLLEKETCESCKAVFECGAKSENCWCGKIELTKEASSKLSKNFKRCLCGECLAKYAENVE
jgi:hypothetical protein